MSLDKAIKYGKEHRKEYHGAKAVDPQCRCHGTCEYCSQGRLRHYKIADIDYKEQMSDIIYIDGRAYSTIYDMWMDEFEDVKEDEQ